MVAFDDIRLAEESHLYDPIVSSAMEEHEGWYLFSEPLCPEAGGDCSDICGRDRMVECPYRMERKAWLQLRYAEQRLLGLAHVGWRIGDDKREHQHWCHDAGGQIDAHVYMLRDASYLAIVGDVSSIRPSFAEAVSFAEKALCRQ